MESLETRLLLPLTSLIQLVLLPVPSLPHPLLIGGAFQVSSGEGSAKSLNYSSEGGVGCGWGWSVWD